MKIFVNNEIYRLYFRLSLKKTKMKTHITFSTRSRLQLSLLIAEKNVKALIEVVVRIIFFKMEIGLCFLIFLINKKNP